MTPSGALVRAALLLIGAVLGVTLAARQLAPLPDLVLVVLVSAALRSGPTAGVVVGLLGGWVLDLLPPGSAVLGTQAILYAVCGLLLGLASRPGRLSLIWVVLVTGFAGLGLESARAVLALSQGIPVDVVSSLARVAATATAALVIVPVIAAVERHAERRRFA